MGSKSALHRDLQRLASVRNILKDKEIKDKEEDVPIQLSRKWRRRLGRRR